jgi:hypothetical protein
MVEGELSLPGELRGDGYLSQLDVEASASSRARPVMVNYPAPKPRERYLKTIMELMNST